MYGFCGGEEGFRRAVTERRIGDMFEIGEYVVYGVKGVCRIEDITHIDISGADKNRLYYVLAPIGDANGKIYVPTDNQKIVIRRVISKEEAEKLIQELPVLHIIRLHIHSLCRVISGQYIISDSCVGASA